MPSRITDKSGRVKVTPHFYMDEFDQPARHGFPRVPYPERWVESRLRPLCVALEALRRRLGDKPLRVLSGWRGSAYNRRIGGARRSQHVEGRAADITVQGVPPARIHAEALVMHRCGLGRLGGLGLYPSFTHIDVRPGRRLARWGGTRTVS